MKSKQLARWAIDQFEYLGIEEVILCGGARNAALLCALSERKNIQIRNFYNESSAAFYALGRAKLKKKVAVLSTSGTAVAQFLPTCIEAYYDSLFLLFVTADRPAEYRKVGAPQCIEQSNILKDFCSLALDLSEIPKGKEYKMFKDTPAHWNLCFEEPLWWEPEESFEKTQQSFFKVEQESISSEKQLEAARFLAETNSRDLIVFSRLDRSLRESAVEWIQKSNSYIYLEASSNLSRSMFSEKALLMSGEKAASELLDAKLVDRVILIGGVPCLRLWRDLDTKYRHIKTYSFDFRRFSGALQIEHKQVELKTLLTQSAEMFQANRAEGMALRCWDRDRERKDKMNSLLKKYPQSEVALLQELSKYILDTDQVYVGNSMSIRQWDLIDFPLVEEFFCNRGANGIDGQASSFLGAHRKDTSRCLALLGDLTLLYDMSWGWAYKFSEAKCSILFVMNNSGGRIFERVFPNPYMLNIHEQDFASLAKHYQLNYQTWTQISQLPTEGHWLIELKPDINQNAEFWKDIEKL